MNIGSFSAASVGLSISHANASSKSVELSGHDSKRHSEFKEAKRAEAFEASSVAKSESSHSSGFHVVG